MSESLTLFNPELQDEYQFSSTLELARELAIDSHRTLRHGLTSGRLEKLKLPKYESPGANTVVRDAETGLIIKSYTKGPRVAKDQFETMNLLANILPRHTEGRLDAVTHLALITGGDSQKVTPTAIIEPASGISLFERYTSSKTESIPHQGRIDKQIKHIRKDLDRSLGVFTSRLLVNDIGDSLFTTYVGVNIFSEDQDGPYTIIDQPFSKLSTIARAALIAAEYYKR